MTLWYACPQCDNRVGITLDTEDEDARIDVRCATRHPRPVRMDRIEFRRVESSVSEPR